MSLPKLAGQGQLFSTAALTGQVFAEDDRYRLFALRIYPLLVEARQKIESAYCQDNGRPGIEPVVLLGISVLQFLEGMPDRQALEQLRYHVGWNLALNRTVGQEVFHPTVLVYFRKRLMENELSDVVFSTILQALVEAGLVERGGRQRLDSTHMVGLVARMSRVENVRETLRLALKELEGQSLSKPQWWELVWERYVCTQLDYRISTAQLRERMIQAGVDGLQLLDWVKSLEAAMADGPQVKLLARVLEENFEWAENKAPVDRDKQPGGAVQNPHEPQAQWSSKGQGRQRKEHIGYKNQVAESVPEQKLAKGEPTRAFVTAIVTQPATGSDLAGAELVEQQQQKNGLDKAPELYVDAAYVSAQVLHQAQAEKREIIGPVKRSMVTEGRLSAEHFDVSIEQQQARCPAGQISTRCTRYTDRSSAETKYRFEWIGICQSCPLRAECFAKHIDHRSLEVGEHYMLLQRRRREQQTEEFQKKTKTRNAIESTQSELVRAHGMRRARYRGLAKAQWQAFMAGAACNVKRWIRHIIWENQRAEPAWNPR
jgi:Transposase DDE domain/Transposase domain (DUF772)